MLKRIAVKQLRLGMFVHEFCGSWMNHPFWRGAFLLDSAQDLQAIRATSIEEVWINTDKGLDVEADRVELKVVKDVEAARAHAELPAKPAQYIDTAQEAARAVKIRDKSRQAVTSMFQDARASKTVNIDEALLVVDEISASVLRNPGALIGLSRLKDKEDYAQLHSVAVCALMLSLARQLGLRDEQIREAGLAGLLHDVGSIMIPPEILNKPGKLTDAEFEWVRTHPAEGHEILRKSNGASEVVQEVCLHHHERVNGSGYPGRIKDDQISMYSRMCAVCDVYDAIISSRPYRNGWEPVEAIRKIAEWSKGGQLDLRIFEAFVKLIGIYPVGTLVRLESNRLAVVVEQTAKSLLLPRVKVFFSIKSNGRIKPEILDLSKPLCRDKIVAHEDAGKWNIPDVQQLWSGLDA